MKKQNGTIRIYRKIVIGIIFFFALILVKLSYVALSKKVDGVDLQAFASNRNTYKSTIHAKRGTIYDVNGDILAQDVNSYTVIAFLSDTRTTNEKNPQHVVDKKYTAKALAPLLNMTEEYILKLLNKDSYQVELGPGGRGITELTREKIASLDLPGINFIASTKRWYKMGNFASYVIGYARKNDQQEIVGEMGIESALNENLTGQNGYSEYQRDVYGYKIPNTPENTKKATPGNNVYLTIDNKIQILLENALDKLTNAIDVNWITFTVANVKTGAIVASASYPGFDLNTLDIKKYTLPLTQYTYEPGSTMKIYSYMATMEAGLYNGSEEFNSGSIKVSDGTIRDYNKVGFGRINFDQGFAYSSNVGAVLVSQKISKNNLKDYYKSLGFGSKTNVIRYGLKETDKDLTAEYAGKVAFKYELEVANAAFGQGLTTTPIQNIKALLAVANNGMLIQPYLIDHITNSATGKIIMQNKRTESGRIASEKTTTKVKELMHDVVYTDIGTGVKYRPSNVSLIGKTGTAQYTDGKNEYAEGEFNNIRSFAGIFPYENPQYVFYISAKQLVGSTNLMANMVKTVIEDIAQTKSIIDERNYVDTNKIASVPQLTNTSREIAEKEVNNNLLVPIIIGDGDKVIKQFPQKKALVTTGTKVFLLTNGQEKVLPDMTNWSYRDAKTYCDLISLECQFNNYGYVTSTDIPVGSILIADQPLIIQLAPK